MEKYLQDTAPNSDLTLRSRIAAVLGLRAESCARHIHSTAQFRRTRLKNMVESSQPCRLTSRSRQIPRQAANVFII